jgi:hypothetical protein
VEKSRLTGVAKCGNLKIVLKSKKKRCYMPMIIIINQYTCPNCKKHFSERDTIAFGKFGVCMGQEYSTSWVACPQCHIVLDYNTSEIRYKDKLPVFFDPQLIKGDYYIEYVIENGIKVEIEKINHVDWWDDD